MAEILQVQHKTLSNQSINQSLSKRCGISYEENRNLIALENFMQSLVVIHSSNVSIVQNLAKNVAC